MGRKRVWPPRVHIHKGEDRVFWNGRWWGLGPAGSAVARAEHGRLLALWSTDPFAVPRSPDDYLLSALCREYISSDAVPESRRSQAAVALCLLQELHLATPAAAFDAPALAAWQNWLCGLTHQGGPKVGMRRFNRTYVGMLTGIVKRMFKWGVATKRVRVEQYQELLTVEGPRRGKVREPRPVEPADPAPGVAVLPLLRPPTRAILQLMRLSVARPDELCRMRPKDVHRDGQVRLPVAGVVDLDAAKVWVYLPDGHKTTHLSKPRWLVFGRRAQRVLRPFLENRDPDAYCFDPREASAALLAERAAGRKTPLYQSHLRLNEERRKAAPKRRPGSRYTSRSLYHGLARACRKAGVPHFSPYQVRHRAFEDVDLKFGLDAAQHIGGHSSPQTTRRYAKRSFTQAAKVAREQG